VSKAVSAPEFIFLAHALRYAAIPSARPSVCHTSDPLLNGSVYLNTGTV